MCLLLSLSLILFFFTHLATTEIYTLSLHDALPISADDSQLAGRRVIRIHLPSLLEGAVAGGSGGECVRSEEHTSELQSLRHLVCRLLLEKKKKRITHRVPYKKECRICIEHT